MRRLAGRSILPLVVAAALAAWPAADAVVREARERTTALPRLAGPGPCMSGRAQLVIPVLDVSDSVIGAGGADPRGRSFEETRYLARHLAHHRCSPKDRLGAVIFAEGVVELEPTPLTSLSIIEAALRRPPAHEIGSGTRLDKALEAAARMAGRFPSHESTVVVLSDMVVDDIDGVARALRRLGPTAPHLVALGDHDAHMDALFASVVELGEASRGEVAIALNEAVASARKSR